MRKVSHRDPHLRVSDGLPRLVLIALPSNDPARFVTTLLAYNLSDAKKMLEMLYAVQPELLKGVVEQTETIARRANQIIEMAGVP